jgi:hypothetical protein
MSRHLLPALFSALMRGYRMDAYTNKGIKDIINEFPEVGRILGEYGIECVSCTVGICALKDILDIHTPGR